MVRVGTGLEQSAHTESVAAASGDGEDAVAVASPVLAKTTVPGKAPAKQRLSLAAGFDCRPAEAAVGDSELVGAGVCCWTRPEHGDGGAPPRKTPKAGRRMLSDPSPATSASTPRNDDRRRTSENERPSSVADPSSAPARVAARARS